MMRDTNKFIEIARRVEADKGPFNLLGFFQREDTPYVWDVVASAPWIDDGGSDSVLYLAHRLHDVLSPDEMRSLSRIAPMDTTKFDVQQLSAAMAGHTPSTFAGPFMGAEILYAVIVAARPVSADIESGAVSGAVAPA